MTVKIMKLSNHENGLEFSGLKNIHCYLEKVLNDELRLVEEERQKFLRDIEQKGERELDSFRRDEMDKAELLLAAERERISRTFKLQRRRALEGIIEKVVQQVIREAAERLRENGEFMRKILPLVREEISPVEEVQEIHFAPGDEGGRDEIASLLQGDTPFTEDASIRYGGFILRKKNGEMINLTMDRLVYRMRDALRLEMMHLLREEGVLSKLEGIYE